MKTYINSRNIITVICFVLFTSDIFAQDTAIIHLTGYQSGSIYWESSTDNINWMTVPGAVADSLQAVFNESNYYRAVITDGTCANLVTNSTHVIYGLSEVTTIYVDNLTQVSATGSGEVINQGISPVYERGVCWGTSPNPTIVAFSASNGSGSGAYTVNFTGLTGNTTYHLRAYAINSEGVSYGADVTFTTPNWNIPCPGISTATDNDGNTYTARLIGRQCWMKENLKTTHYSDGTALVDGTGAGDISNHLSTKYWFVYYDQIINKNIYGLLYNWAAIMNNSPQSNSNPSGVQGICPTGWHLPSDQEWQQLEMTLGMTFEEVIKWNYRGVSEGGKIKESGTSHWTWPNNGATNQSGFTALPGGKRYDDANGFTGLSTDGYWGSCSGSYSSSHTIRILNSDEVRIARASYDTSGCYSVRCIRNDTIYASLPTVTTDSITSITQTSATIEANVSSDGGEFVVSRGICWNTTGSPTLSNSHMYNNYTGLGNFTCNMTGLANNTLYYVRTFAANNIGITYGNEINFTTLISSNGVPCTGLPTITDYDGNVYNTVLIGTQCWMRENLKTTHYADGTSLPDGSNAGDLTNNNSAKYWFVYDNNTINKITYGLLYTWTAAMNNAPSSNNIPSGVQGVCPNGWHLPSDAEWIQLRTFLDGDTSAYYKLRESGTSHWNSDNSNITNETGFTLLPGGHRVYLGWYEGLEGESRTWTATQNGSSSAWYQIVIFPMQSLSNIKSDGYSVRCLKNN
ncbi:MAG: hypothetical protein NTW49_08325 [Bacteroidia bacterium]|nr:hypothetical protein [Bacteroidia bacterium]